MARKRSDEPQHVTQGRITLDQLTLLGIEYRIVDATTDILACIQTAVTQAMSQSRPTALVVRKGALQPL